MANVKKLHFKVLTRKKIILDFVDSSDFVKGKVFLFVDFAFHLELYLIVCVIFLSSVVMF